VTIPDARLAEVTAEALRRDFGSQWLGLTQAVAWVAIERGFTPPRQDTRIIQIEPADEPALRRYVDQLLEAGVLALGMRSGAAVWPWLSLTDRGRELVAGGDGLPAPRDLEG
jgi:hypothetical protein